MNSSLGQIDRSIESPIDTVEYVIVSFFVFELLLWTFHFGSIIYR